MRRTFVDVSENIYFKEIHVQERKGQKCFFQMYRSDFSVLYIHFLRDFRLKF
jgi:hypothetical protein